MAVKKSQQRAVNRYIARHYDRIYLTADKGKRDRIKAHASATGESMSAFINRAIDEALEREEGKIGQ